MGANPENERLKQVIQSKQYNSEEKRFQNPQSTPLSTGRSWLEIIIDKFMNGEEGTPEEKFPEDPPGLSELKLKSEDVRFIWFGHSTILLEMDTKRILIDPVFSNYVSPIPGFIKRFQPPVFKIEEIPDVDIVLISHDHYDHLDYETISKLVKLNIHYVVPLGVGAHLEFWGIDKKNITELDWWSEINLNGLRFTSTPSQHFSGRGIFNGNSTLWSSWAIKGKNQNVFFSGDSGYSKHYKEIGNRLGPFDLTFLENGAYSPDWKFVHQLPEEGVQAHIDLKGKAMVPIHWGMFDLALHTWYDPIQRVTTEAKKRGVTLLTPKLGQLISLKEFKEIEEWWIPLINKKK